MAKCNSRFIEKISQLKSDIRSCRCKNFSLKQVSGLKGGTGDHPLYSLSFLLYREGILGVLKFFFIMSQARTERTERVKPSLALAWDM